MLSGRTTFSMCGFPTTLRLLQCFEEQRSSPLNRRHCNCRRPNVLRAQRNRVTVSALELFLHKCHVAMN